MFPASFKTQNPATAAHEGVNRIGKLVNAATLWYGAHWVMDNQLTVGQFVAFNMLAQRVSQPTMRMAQLWTDFQQTGISVARLSDIVNTRTEVPPSSTAQLPPVKGRTTRWWHSKRICGACGMGLKKRPQMKQPSSQLYGTLAV